MPPPGRSRFKESTKEKLSQGRTSASVSKPTNTTITTSTRAHTPMANSNSRKNGAMAIKEHPLLRGSSSKSTVATSNSKTTATSNKKVSSTHRPTTPSGKNFVEINKQTAGTKSPPPTPRVVPRTPSPDTCPSPTKKKPATTHADFSKPNAKNKKLKIFLADRAQELHEAEVEIQECEEVILALQERVRQVEARNRELQSENDILSAKVFEHESQKSPTSILSAIMNNTQRIRGEENTVKVAPAPIVPAPNVTTPILSTANVIMPKQTPQPSVLSTLVTPIANAKVNNPLTPTPVSDNGSIQRFSSPIESKPLAQPLYNNSSSAAPLITQSRIQPTKMESPLKPETAIMEETDDSDDEFSFNDDKNEYDQNVFSGNGIHSSVSSFDEDNSDEETHDNDELPNTPFNVQKVKPVIKITHDKANFSDSPSLEINPKQLADSDNSSEQSLNVDSHKISNIGGKSSFGNNPLNSNSNPKPVTSNHLADFQQLVNGNEQPIQSSSLVTKLALEKSSQDYFSYSHESTVNPVHRESFSSVKSDESDMWSTPSASSSHHEYYSSSATSRSTTRTTQSTNSISAFGSPSQRSLHYNTNEDENNSSHPSLAASYTDNPLPFNPTNEFFYYSQNRVAQNDSANPQQQNNSEQLVLNSENSNLSSTAGLNSNGCSISERSQSQQSFSSTSDIQSSVASSENSTTPTPVNDRPSTPKKLLNQSSAKKSSQSSNRSMACSNDSSRPSTSQAHYRLLSPTSVSPARPRNPTPLTSSSSTESLNNFANSTDNTSSATPLSSLSKSSSSQNSTPAFNSNRSAPLVQDETQSTDNTFSPPTPPDTNDSMAVFKHYLRLLSETCSRNSPLNHYELQKYIDEGSSAKVYAATSRDTREELAIKVIPLTYSLEFIFNEIYVLKNLKHKNVVGYKESFLRWDGKTREIWTVMEKCSRGDVTSRAGNISQKEVARIARDILNGLKHVHETGIIHRDIKLENILMAANNDVKIADFGVCSLTPTSTTGMVGTIPYMAPDVVNVNENNPYSTKADIWSLGICILELLTGKAAWGRLNDTEIFSMLKRGEKPPTFGRLRKKADIGWEAVDFLERCFVKNSELRCSAEELLQHPFITSLLA
ncbi:7569_t:CDS:2 [Ambispora gerdemannii]|uniref:7569_t:CDS:1 n=1 Tax=Ambispora gerdemannii TaxID=144530 RepID=A0A9N8WEH9_9GLOM|nr:7569_t:CDS:2 [Ambispora gerdemannii]